jgi:hypothetical protein
MKTIAKYATAMALTGALAVAAASPSEARHGRHAAAIGFGVGAVAGAAIASSAYNGGYYRYYGDPGYYGYTYAPGYVHDSYAYEPGHAYVTLGYGYYDHYNRYGYYDGHNWARQHSTNNFAIESQR